MKTFSKVLNYMLLAGMLSSIVIIGVTYDDPQLWPDSTVGERERWNITIGERAKFPVNIPSWKASDATRFPGCEPMKKDSSMTHFLVVTQDNVREEMSYDETVSRTQGHEHADDVWVIGVCK